MKKLFFLFALLVVVVAIYPFLNSSEDTAVVTGLPWQVEILPDGNTRVFGLKIGESKISEVLEILGNDMELAIIAATDTDIDETGSLEMYYGHYRAGLLSGKLVLQTNINKQKIKRWRDNAMRFEYMASGLAKKYILSTDDLPEILHEIVVSVTFIPVVNLDEEVILARFGEPEQRIELEDATHYLYPRMGLDIAHHADAKEILQYVPPAHFQQLVEPLLKPWIQVSRDQGL